MGANGIKNGRGIQKSLLVKSLPSSILQHKSILAILILFLASCLIYDSSTPLFEGLDEVWHYAMVKRLADGDGLPIVHPGVDTAWRQQGTQPPLYYSILAAATTWVDTGDYGSHRMLSSRSLTIGLPDDIQGEKFWYYHTRSEDFPYRRTALAVHLGRWISMLMASGTVVLSYAMVRQLFPYWTQLAPLTSSIIALNPGFLFVSTQVNNDNLSNLLGAAAALLLVRIWRHGFSLPMSLVLSLVCAALSLTKLNGLLILVAIAILCGLCAVKHHAWTQYFYLGMMCVCAVALTAGWWYARNVMLYGSPLPIEIHRSFVTVREISIIEVMQQYWGHHASYWGVFGLANVAMERPVYQIYAVFSWAALVGAVVWICRNRQRARSSLPVPVIQGLIMLAGTLYWTQSAPGPAGRLTYPAIGTISLLGAIGLLALIPHRWHSRAALVLISGMSLIALTTPFTIIRPTYEQAFLKPPMVREGVSMQYPQEAYLGDVVKLLGFDATSTSGVLRVTLHWQVMSRTAEHLIVFVHLFDSQGEFVTGHDGVTLGSNYPSEVWSPGEWLADTHDLSIAEDLESGEYQLVVGMYNFVDYQRLAVKDSDGLDVLDNVIPLLPKITLSG